MEREICTHKTTSPSEGMPAAANFHFQILASHSNKSNFGETFVLAFIPGEMHQRIFERAVVSFEDHYYRAEIEDSNFERFSRSIRAINTGMEEIRQYYKEQRHQYEYSFCILSVTESEFYLSACGQTYIIAEDSSSRLHEVYKPEEFLDFSEIISGAHTDLDNLFLGVTSVDHHPISSLPEHLAYSILLATKGRTELPWLGTVLDFSSTNAEKHPAITQVPQTGMVRKAHKHLKMHYRTLKSRIVSKKHEKEQLPHTTTHHKTKPIKRIVLRLQSLWTRLWSTYINPNPLRAIIVVGIFLGIILASIIGWNIFGNNSKTTAEYKNIQNLYSQAQTSKTNQDTASAVAQFNQVINEISQLTSPEKTALNKYAQGHKEKSTDEILKSSQLQLDEIHNVFHVGATKVFTEANFAYSLLTNSLAGLTLLNSPTGKLLNYIPTTKKTTGKEQGALADTKWLISSDDTAQSYAVSEKLVYQVKPDLSVSESRTSAKSWPIAQAVATYSGNLYFLMPSAGQIYRFRSVGSNQFGPQTNYLKINDPSLNDAVSFVVGTTIYTTNKVGAIHQYNQNARQSFSTSGMPSLSSVSQLAYRTAPESLVLLDTEKGSFTFLNIRGNTAFFQKQLVVDNTTNITNFTLDEKNNLLYFVSTDGLFSLQLP